MPRPRIYEADPARKQDKHGNLTAKFRMRDSRRAKKLGMTMDEYREHVAYEAQKAKKRERVLKMPAWSGLPEFLTMVGLDPEKAIFVGAYGGFEPRIKVDFVTAHAAWKRTLTQLHPDKQNGDEVQATRLNELWAKYKGMFPEKVAVPAAEPVTKPKRRVTKRDRRETHLPHQQLEGETRCSRNGMPPRFIKDSLIVDREPTCKQCLFYAIFDAKLAADPVTKTAMGAN